MFFIYQALTDNHRTVLDFKNKKSHPLFNEWQNIVRSIELVLGDI